MKNLTRAVMFTGALGVFAAAAFAGPVEDRQELMESVGDAMKVAVPMAKGEAPFDEAKAAEAMQTINSVPDKFVKLFPEGSGDHPDTEAAPRIWEDMEGFLERAEALKTASAKAAEAAAQGQDAFRSVLFGEVGKACKNCHDAYRIKKN